MSTLELKNVSKQYDGNYEAVKNIDLYVEDKSFAVLVGPSGCGKSTTLRMIAGLEDITSGEIRIDDKVVNNTPSKDRNIAMVFQNYALYPHMSVYDNMAFGLKMKKTPKAEIDKKIKTAAQVLGLTSLLKRKPGALSGGERQRVAMGRAMVREPKIFLMDEPLSNLDAGLRIQMRQEISRLHKDLQTTFVYVTHDQVEAMTLGQKIVVMKNGNIVQHDTPMNLYKNPVNTFVAGFIGSYQMNILQAELSGGDDSRAILSGGLEIELPQELKKASDKYCGKNIFIGVRPEHLDINSEGQSKQKIMEGTISHMEIYGGEALISCERNGVCIKVKTEYKPGLTTGANIALYMDIENLHLFNAEGKSIRQDG